MSNLIDLPYMKPIDVKKGDKVLLSPTVNKESEYTLINVGGERGFTCIGYWMKDQLKGELIVKDIDNQEGAIQVANPTSFYWVHRSHILVKGVDYE